jgi:hypothetical protein
MKGLVVERDALSFSDVDSNDFESLVRGYFDVLFFSGTATRLTVFSSFFDESWEVTLPCAIQFTFPKGKLKQYNISGIEEEFRRHDQLDANLISLHILSTREGLKARLQVFEETISEAALETTDDPKMAYETMKKAAYKLRHLTRRKK